MEDVDLEQFYRHTQAARMRAAELYQHARKSLVEQQELLVTACEELYDALESLEVAGEALRQKHNNFTTPHELVELERQHLQNLFEYVPDAYLVTDMVGIIRQANCATAKLLNTKLHFLLGKPLVVFVAANQHRAFRCKLNQLHQADQVQEWEVPLLPRNGKPIDVALTVSIIRNQQDLPIALGWLVRDVSKRKQAQMALRRIYSAIEANQPIVITSAKLDELDPEITFVNQAFTEMTGYTKDELLGKTPRILQGARTERSVLERLRQNLLQGQPFHGKVTNYTKDGLEYHVEIWCTPIQNESGEVTQFASIQQVIAPQLVPIYQDSVAQSSLTNP